MSISHIYICPLEAFRITGQSTADASLFDVTLAYASVFSTSQLTRQYFELLLAEDDDLEVCHTIVTVPKQGSVF